MRLGACLGVAVDLIEPLGFEWDDKRVRRTAMDYIDHVEVVRHRDFASFLKQLDGARLILATTRARAGLYEFRFAENDVLMFGRESAGVPGDVAEQCDERIRIPIRADVRSFNLATAASIAAAEALRQTGKLPA